MMLKYIKSASYSFYVANNASTTFNIAVKEAVANVNSELTKWISSDGQPMKVNRAKKILYRLPGKITMDSSTKTLELATIRNEAQRMRIENLCNWMNKLYTMKNRLKIQMVRGDL